MNVVEAVERWIDEHDNELSDEDYDSALQILDVISASRFADVDTAVIDDGDIEHMMTLLDPEEDADYADDLLRSAIYGDEADLDAEELDDEPDDAEDLDDTDLDDSDLGDGELDDDTDGGADGPTQGTVVTAPIALPSVAPIEFREGDALGPSFLSPSRRRRSSRGKRLALSAVLMGALAAFAIGTVNLVDSLDKPEQQLVATAPGSEPEVADDAPEDEPEERPDPDDPTAIEDVPSGRVGLRLVTGDVVVATWERGTAPPEFGVVYEASSGDLLPAVHFAWLDDAIGVADSEGNVYVVDLTDSSPTPQRIYQAGAGLGKVVEIGFFDGRIAARTEAGAVFVMSADEPADPDQVTVVWAVDDPSDDTATEDDTTEEDDTVTESESASADPTSAATTTAPDDQGARAVDLASQRDALAFTLDNGNAKLVRAGALDTIEDMWSAEGQPPAFIVSSDRGSFLLGVGEGAVARYELTPTAGPRTTAVWDPFATDPVPAIGFSGAGPVAAVVLSDGSIVLADDTATGEKIWDPAETELRTLAVSAAESEIFLLLEAGTVVHVPLNQDFIFESIWDVTDETRSAADQVELEHPE